MEFIHDRTAEKRVWYIYNSLVEKRKNRTIVRFVEISIKGPFHRKFTVVWDFSRFNGCCFFCLLLFGSTFYLSMPNEEKKIHLFFFFGPSLRTVSKCNIPCLLYSSFECALLFFASLLVLHGLSLSLAVCIQHIDGYIFMAITCKSVPSSSSVARWDRQNALLMTNSFIGKLN